MKTKPTPPGEATLPPIITVDELAKLLRMNRKTAYEAIQRNEIPGVHRIGRQYRVSRDAVLAWLVGGASGSAEGGRTGA